MPEKPQGGILSAQRRVFAEAVTMAHIHVSRIRWARGALIALLAALALLIHHETAALGSPGGDTMRSTHAGHVMPGMASSSGAAPQGFASHHPGPSYASAPTHGTEGSACADAGMQHCAAASVDTVKLASPQQGHVEQAAHPHQSKAGRSPGGTISRAPPDLSVLSQLRI
ncbi:hypothetical protein [Streptomyces sp. NPDC096132]|uniref:hypothetical protein n=1 Tax=Streptomyces sp. NPDC096132 TaxID=3366075 RepID=UPI00380BE149